MAPLGKTVTFLVQSAGGRSRSSSHLLLWLMHLGGVGLFAVAVIDSSMIPIPIPGSTDLVLLLLVAYRASSVGGLVSFVASAFAGSVVGGYMTWAAGVKGGSAAIEKLGKGRFVRHVSGWINKNGWLSVAVAALLPPPIPLLPFLLAAGALGLSRTRFLTAYCAARIVRYSLIGWLAYTYGRRFVILWEKELRGWSTTIISVYTVLVVIGIAVGVWKFMKSRRRGESRNLSARQRSAAGA
jgi:membrane protein DedA with SNARE-associated domain